MAVIIWSHLLKGETLMLQYLKLPMQIKGETLESYTDRCIIPYPFIVPCCSQLRSQLSFRLGMAQATLQICITDGKVTEALALYYDGSFSKLEKDAILGIRTLFTNLTDNHGFSFENDEDRIEDFDYAKFNVSMETSYEKFKR